MPGGMAPPRIRRTRPWDSSDCRSVRTVTVETPKRADRSLTRTKPCSSTRALMRSWRTSAGSGPAGLPATGRTLVECDARDLQLADGQEAVAGLRVRARQVEAQAGGRDRIEA